MKRFSESATLALFLALLMGLGAAFWLLPDRRFSSEENRSLAMRPRFDADDVLDGSFAARTNDWFCDQFPLRDTFVGVKGLVSSTLGRGENNGILRGRDGCLARRRFDVCRADGSTLGSCDLYVKENLLAAAEGLNRAAEAQSVPFSVLLTGRNLDVASTSFDYPAEVGDAMRDTLYAALDESVDAIDTVPLLRARHDSGEYVYYKTDHHWTTRGAYYAYAELLRAWGMAGEIIPQAAFEKECTDGFYGTLFSAGGMRNVTPDTLELWQLSDDGEYSVTADGQLLDGFYSRRHLDKKDKYAVFLDGVHEVVTVKKKSGEARPVLVMFKDSFANSLSPFLARHFDLVLLNLSSVRTDYTDITAYAALYRADRVLLIYTLENAMTTARLGALR